MLLECFLDPSALLLLSYVRLTAGQCYSSSQNHFSFSFSFSKSLIIPV